ncbi:transport-related protein [Trichosporon asahii var. asahii CBS 2479]|uniref:Protein BFR2 n=1 Tax=Trichosporon asahii var. asahii (strain ATCC 90039 / CBS 2479 / JCM 2466 / KCTC 7840 / NBRC 103889/ NCYC 2677 / UAMH 7654) TaxID=1186058 RepID=J5Q5B7_TRIAS|nr:transport-related protein [Trichosporon asahii var. asahii CBS 2479]EJT45538.1 transport-related protein [Trichosporon asahii var. asahii CBS 2479]
MVSLAEQLKQLEDDVPKTVDPEEAYADIDGHDLSRSHAAREHYTDVGPSALRRGEVAQTLLSDKYEGKPSSRMKIFDDDEEASEPEDEPGYDEEEEEDEDEEHFDEDEEDYDEDEGEEEEDDEDEEEEDEDEGEDQPAPSGKALDPMGALKASKMKDIEKGGAIKRQRDLFDSLMTTRITFQKALTTAFGLPVPLPSDPAGEIPSTRDSVLASLGKLNDTLLSLRTSLILPGSEPVPKRRKTDSDPTSEEYWRDSATDSFALVDASHPALVPLLAKWSTKIQAATSALGSRAAGGSKLMQGTKPTGVVDAIDASLSQKRDKSKPLLEDAEHAYRALLREVIESKQGTTPVDLMHLRREKKRKREAERGGSKGRRIRYTVHDKAVNFVVPVPLNGWGEEQTDELFASLLGGAGTKGATSEMPAQENVELGGLRMF